MGKKYVIEIEQQYGANTSKETHMTVPPMHLYKVKGFNSLVFDQNGLDKLEPYIEPDDESSYKKGLEDAWEAVKYLWHNGTLMFDAWPADEMMDYYKKIRKENEQSERIKNENVSALKLYSYIKQEINPYGKPFDGTVYEFGNKILHYINDNLLGDES